MNLKQEIAKWDGSSVNDQALLYQKYRHEGSLTKTLIECCVLQPLEIAATWLIKRHQENGPELKEDEVATVINLLPDLEHWKAKLHFLQFLGFLQITLKQKVFVETFLRLYLGSQNKFLRAWTYNGFHELSLQYPEYRDKTKSFFEMALRDEAPSFKARIRNILKSTSDT